MLLYAKLNYGNIDFSDKNGSAAFNMWPVTILLSICLFIRLVFCGFVTWKEKAREACSC